LDVHEDEVGPPPRDGGNRLLSVLSLSQFEAGIAEQIPEDLPVIHLIFDYKDALAHEGPVLRSRRLEWSARLVIASL
jgi:hypothetical protein